jgi:hypothetical protein
MSPYELPIDGHVSVPSVAFCPRPHMTRTKFRTDGGTVSVDLFREPFEHATLGHQRLLPGDGHDSEGWRPAESFCSNEVSS